MVRGQREMNRSRIPIRAGKYVNESVTGTSSNRANPFFYDRKKFNDRRLW